MSQRRLSHALICCATATVALAPVFAGMPSPSEVDYQADHQRLVELYSEKDYAAGIELLERMREQYPDHAFANYYNLALFNALAGHDEAAMETWEEGLDRGIWFSLDPEMEVFERFAGEARFERIRERCAKMRARAQQEAVATYQVATPEAMEPGRRYPLFIALHGYNCNADRLSGWWTSDRLREDFVVAYVQSSQVAYGNGRYYWRDLKQGRADVARIYHELMRKYPVAADEVLVGGFSDGARMAIELAMSNVIPVAGVIALAPSGDLPPELCPKHARKAARKGLKVAILAHPKDKYYPQQELITQILEDAGVEYRLLVQEGDAPYGIPANFDSLLDNTLSFVSGD